jgi:cytochrome c2
VIRPRFFFAILLLLGFAARHADAQDAAGFFQQRCTMCHTIGGGRLVGPDLKDVAKRKDREWLEHFIQNPKAIIDSGDAYALDLQKNSRGIVMPTMPGLTPELTDALLDLIQQESALPESHFVGKKAPERALTAEDISAGTEIFLGNRRLTAGGPPCISCHTLGTLHSLGGGHLGPDLTQVYQRLGERKGLEAWLSSPGTTTMQAVFKPHPLKSEEITPLVAVFQDAAKNSHPSGARAQLNFFAAGTAGFCLGLGIMGWAWRGRIRGVRRKLVKVARGGK